MWFYTYCNYRTQLLYKDSADLSAITVSVQSVSPCVYRRLSVYLLHCHCLVIAKHGAVLEQVVLYLQCTGMWIFLQCESYCNVNLTVGVLSSGGGLWNVVSCETLSQTGVVWNIVTKLLPTCIIRYLSSQLYKSWDMYGWRIVQSKCQPRTGHFYLTLFSPRQLV